MKTEFIETLEPEHINQARLIGAMIAGGSSGEAIDQQWQRFLVSLEPLLSPIDINALVAWVMREAYQQNLEDLNYYTEKVKFFNDQKKKIRQHVNETRKTLSYLRESFRSAEKAIEEAIANAEEQLNCVGDDAQLANVDLQNILQKQQQTLQMMSQISKTLHDTAMATIRKIGS